MKESKWVVSRDVLHHDFAKKVTLFSTMLTINYTVLYIKYTVKFLGGNGSWNHCSVLLYT